MLMDIQVLLQDNHADRFFHQGIDEGDDFRGASPQPAKFGDDERVGRARFPMRHSTVPAQ